MSALATSDILRLAAKLLVREGVSAVFRPKPPGARGRATLSQLKPLEAAGLIEFGPRHRWARLTALGQREWEDAP